MYGNLNLNIMGRLELKPTEIETTAAYKKLYLGFLLKEKLICVLGKDLVVSKYECFLPINLQGDTAIFRQNYLITNVECHLHLGTISGGITGAHSKHFALVSF